MLETSIQWTCDGCGITDVWPEMNVSKQEVRAEMRKGGWRHYGALDYCSKCVAGGAAQRREAGMGLIPERSQATPPHSISEQQR